MFNVSKYFDSHWCEQYDAMDELIIHFVLLNKMYLCFEGSVENTEDGFQEGSKNTESDICFYKTRVQYVQ